MITLYTWKTPNGRKPAILLEELGVKYQAFPVDLSKNEQFTESFLKISPNNKIPAIADDDLVLFESGAILTYLAEKHGKFLAKSGPERYKTMEWLYWQVAGWGPMLGQLGYFTHAKEKDPFAIDRFVTECDRLLNVIERRLVKSKYLGGDEYTIADIATYPWAVAATTYLAEPLKESLNTKNAFKHWMEIIAERPAVQKGMRVLEDSSRSNH